MSVPFGLLCLDIRAGQALKEKEHRSANQLVARNIALGGAC